MDDAKTPCDWDGVSYCARHCGNAATHRKAFGMAGDIPVIELLCCDCARGNG